MGTIELEGMEFYAYHGHFEEERVIGNKFQVKLSINTDLKKASESDKLKDTINYKDIYDLIKEEMKIKSYLLENVAKRILDKLYAQHQTIEKATIKISKLNPPMGGQIAKVSVTITK
ncbi:MAG: dihydroneopterin aldolase [Mariniphaga sp.]|nr:dihydroneopterin aldolase [Mariniphaga sp.]